MGCGCSDKLSQQQKQEITSRAKQGFSATIIAAQLGVSKEAVIDWLEQPAPEPVKVKSYKKKSISDGSTEDL